MIKNLILLCPSNVVPHLGKFHLQVTKHIAYLFVLLFCLESEKPDAPIRVFCSAKIVIDTNFSRRHRRPPPRPRRPYVVSRFAGLGGKTGPPNFSFDVTLQFSAKCNVSGGPLVVRLRHIRTKLQCK